MNEWYSSDINNKIAVYSWIYPKDQPSIKVYAQVHQNKALLESPLKTPLHKTIFFQVNFALQWSHLELLSFSKYCFAEVFKWSLILITCLGHKLSWCGGLLDSKVFEIVTELNSRYLAWLVNRTHAWLQSATIKHLTRFPNIQVYCQAHLET